MTLIVRYVSDLLLMIMVFQQFDVKCEKRLCVMMRSRKEEKKIIAFIDARKNETDDNFLIDDIYHFKKVSSVQIK